MDKATTRRYSPRFVDAFGKALAGIAVSIFHHQSDHTNYNSAMTAGPTDERGHYRNLDLVPGEVYKYRTNHGQHEYGAFTAPLHGETFDITPEGDGTRVIEAVYGYIAEPAPVTTDTTPEALPGDAVAPGTVTTDTTPEALPGDTIAPGTPEVTPGEDQRDNEAAKAAAAEAEKFAGKDAGEETVMQPALSAEARATKDAAADEAAKGEPADKQEPAGAATPTAEPTAATEEPQGDGTPTKDEAADKVEAENAEEATKGASDDEVVEAQKAAAADELAAKQEALEAELADKAKAAETEPNEPVAEAEPADQAVAE